MQRNFGPNERDVGNVSRRQFVCAGLSLAGASLANAGKASARSPKLRLPAGVQLARVARVQKRHVVDGPKIHRPLLGEMLDDVIMSVAQRPTVGDAWHKLLDPEDIIGIKFNRSGQRIIGTSGAMADALITSLQNAGWPSGQIVLIEPPPGAVERHHTHPAVQGYENEETDFGSGSDQLAAALSQVTALIDVPFLKTHNLCGMTCSLKNLSHGLVKHPARYHANGCSPFIGDIVATEAIQSRLRLCLVDALRVVFADGPRARLSTLSDEGILAASTDPVALDTFGLSVLNDVRRRHDLDPIARSAEEIGYLAASHERGLGIAVWHGIKLVQDSAS